MLGLQKKQLYLILFFFIFQPLILLAINNDGSRYSLNSVLKEGSWYKIKVSATGVYKLTYDDLKNTLKLDNPANVRVFGYGGYILDEDFTKPYVDDLPEVSIWMSNDREKFGKGDYILFYARGSIKWEYNDQTGEFEQTQNPYSSDSYYFVTESEQGPALMQRQASLEQGTEIINTFNDYLLHENESVNLGQSGREFYGDDFNRSLDQNFTLKTYGATADKATVRYDFVSHITFNGGQSLTALLNNSESEDTFATVIPKSELYTEVFGTRINKSISTTSLKEVNNLNLKFKKINSSDKNLYLNYIRVNYKRKLKPYESVTFFRNVDSKIDNLTYNISDATASILVFDVTENTLVKQIDTQLNGNIMSFSASNINPREYAMVDLSENILSPVLVDKNDTRVGKISNQDLHSVSGYDMVIIVQPYLQAYANDLASLHEKDSGLKSLVVSPEDIYNEFSSGKPDVTAYRRFMKMFYDRAGGGEDRPHYLLLFGGGTYDNRFIKQTWGDAEKKSMLLTYQSQESLTELTSFVTDDYLGFLDDTEGVNLGKDQLDISVGRLPVRNKGEAADILAKIQDYVEGKNKGIWQSNLLFVADDLIGSGQSTNETWPITDAESLSTYVDKYHPEFLANKIYEDAYTRVTEANGDKYPDATQALLNKIDEGALVLNFIGHGSTSSWTHESLLTSNDIKEMSNDRLAMWITATCDFSRFDADTQSAGLLALLKRYGGTISLFSTVRTVYINGNTVMNDNISKYLLTRDSYGKPLRLGDIIRKAKLEMPDESNKLRFALLGDPALRLSISDDTYNVEVSSMNGIDSSEKGINIQALDNVTITGNVVGKNGAIATHYNGTLEAIVYDAQQNLRTKGNQRGGKVNDDLATNYSAYTNTLYSGKVKIENGVFRIEFVAPKDILYNTDTKGKIIFLGYDDQGANKVQGEFSNYTVGGTNTNIPEEFDGPVIEKMTLNDIELSKDKGDIYVNSTPLFIAKVSDETGINLTNALGHNIALIIDGKSEYNVTPYFENSDDSFKKGVVRFRIPELSLGSHNLQFRIWDVWNNSTLSDVMDFIVSTGSYSFEIWGNPAKSETKFVFMTEAPGIDINVKISVYSLTGKMIWNNESRGAADTLSQYIYTWDLNVAGGGRIAPGVYVCTAEITANGKVLSVKSQKLMVSASY